MSSNFSNLSKRITHIEDGSSCIVASWHVRSVDTSDNSAHVSLCIESSGYQWLVNQSRWLSVPDGCTVEACKALLSYSVRWSRCLNDPNRKRPRESVTERAWNGFDASLQREPELWCSTLEAVCREALAVAGAPAPAAGASGADPAALRAAQDEAAALRAELAALKAAAPAAPSAGSSLDSLICRSVVEAVTPQIVESVRAQVGALAGAVPVPVTVNLFNGSTITTGAAVRHEVFADALQLLSAGLPLWLVGDAGTGKSRLCEQLAEALGCEYFYSGAILDEFAGLKGFIDANGVKHGTEFTRALEAAAAGRDVLLCLDECDGSTPEVLLVLNNLLSGGAVECMGEAFRMSDHLHIVACGNTHGRGGSTAYTRSIIDAATLDRFMFLTVDYSPAIELSVAGGDEALASFARTMRETARSRGVDLLVTYRTITRLRSAAAVCGMKVALQGGFVRGLDRSDVQTLVSATAETLRGNVWRDALAALV